MAEQAASTRPRVVIVGAGFGGLEAAKGLRRTRAEVTVVDRRNHHLFQPLLYQVATAALDPSDIASPVRAVLRRSANTEVLLAEVTGVDRQRRRVLLADRELAYDWLIVGTGARDSYFGHDAWTRSAPGLKSLEEALEIRRRVLGAFERAEYEPDPDLRCALMTFVIVGAGPTGVELAGALSEMARQSLPADFRHIDTRTARIVLVEGMDRVLPGYPPGLSDDARRTLERLGIEVRTGTRVTGIDHTGVTLGSERIATRTALWAAGVIASPLGAALGAEVDRTGRVRVTPELTLPGDARVLVVGDAAYVEQDGRPVPGVAPAAMQMGAHAARNVVRAMRGQPLEPFRYRDKGMFAVIGRGAAVGVVRGRIAVSGFLAWVAWLGIHLFFLVGFRNRAAVMASWAYSYLTYRRIARLITGSVPALEPGSPPVPGGDARVRNPPA